MKRDFTINLIILETPVDDILKQEYEQSVQDIDEIDLPNLW